MYPYHAHIGRGYDVRAPLRVTEKILFSAWTQGRGRVDYSRLSWIPLPAVRARDPKWKDRAPTPGNTQARNPDYLHKGLGVDCSVACTDDTGLLFVYGPL